MKTTAKFLVLLVGVLLIPALSAPAITPPPEQDSSWVNGFRIYRDFLIVLKPEHACYGLPTGKYSYHTCKLCSGRYVRQAFGKDNTTERYLYADSQCKKSQTGYHDNLSLGPVLWCPCVTVITTKP